MEGVPQVPLRGATVYTQLVRRLGLERRDAASAGHPDAARRKDLGAIPADLARPGRRGAGLIDTEQQNTSTAGR